MKKQHTTEQQRFEFSLLINNKIICQRLFDVKGYNEEVKESIELKEMMDNIVGINIDDVNNDVALGEMGIIPKFLKGKSIEYLWGYYDPYRPQKTDDILYKSVNEKVDDFQFEVKVDGVAIAIATFSGNQFPPKVRYSVDIRELIPEIIQEIKYYLSKNSYTKEYGAISLNTNIKKELTK